MHARTIASSIALFMVASCTGGGPNTPPPAAGETSVAQTQSASAWMSKNDYYTVTNLGTLGGNDSVAASITENGWVAGASNESGDQSSEAVVWRNGNQQKLGTLGGQNSGVEWRSHNNFGLVAGISETSDVDPLGEDWSCQAFFPTVPDTKHVCLGFSWVNGAMTALRPLGGVNSFAAGANDEGQIVGWAETPVHDSTCTAVTQTPQSFYQVLQFEPVVWQPTGEIKRLPTYSSDPDGAATAINDRGQIVGISGTCDQAVGRFTAAHAVIWQDGEVTLIPTFGGVSWNTPEAINAWGQVAGFANLPGDANGQFQPMGFVWQRGGATTMIHPLSGDTNTEATGINDLGQVVGVSFNANTGTSRAFIWENGRTMDLNSFLPQNSPLYLTSAGDIDDRGDIVGEAAVLGTTQAPAFLATPQRHGWDPATATPSRTTVSAPVLSPAARRALFRGIGQTIRN